MGGQYRQQVRVEELNQMQVYLGEETIEDYQEGVMTRRAMLRRLIAICGSSAAAAALMAACGVPATAPSTGASTPQSSAASASPAPTEAATAATEATSAPTAVPVNTASATSAAVNSPVQAPTAAGATAAGGAAGHAALSVAADDSAVKGSDVSFGASPKIGGYLARPATDGTYPGVIVIHENRGLTDHIKDIARRLAKAGYIALAPDLVSRFGGTASMTSDKVAGALGQAKPEDLISDLNSGVDYLMQTAGVKAGKTGVVGFCFGGGYTLRLAAANPKITAAVSYYGPVPQPASQMASTNAAILGQYGATDQRVDSMIPSLEKVLKDAGKTFEKYTYDGAGHAFNNDTGQAYNEAAAVPAWKHTLDWFAKYLA